MTPIQLSATEPKERGSRELWLDAAYRALIDGGIEAVRILPLSERLRLSRTSFYWFFTDREALLSALLDMWQQRNTGGLTAAAAAYAETPAEAALNILACFIKGVDFDPRFEFAIRGWALQSDEVMGCLRAADEARIDALRAMLERFGYDPIEADVRARTIYLVQIGYISMQVRETLETRMTRIAAYTHIYTGTQASARELARFYAGFDYHPPNPPPATEEGARHAGTTEGAREGAN